MQATLPDGTSDSPPAYPLVGHLPVFLRDKLGFLLKSAATCGDCVRLQIGEPTYLLNHPEDIRHVLLTNEGNYEKSPRMTSARGQRLFGAGLVSSSAATHHQQRQLLRPVFQRQAVASFSEAIINCTEATLAGWKPGAEFDVAAAMMGLSHRITGKILFGVDYAGEGRALSKAITIRRHYIQYMFGSLFPFPEHLPTRINRDYRRAIRQIDEAIYRMIAERRAPAAAHHDLLALLMRTEYADGTGMNDQQVRDEALTLLIAGYETIGEALSWTCYLLAQHPEVESKLRSELQEVLGGRVPTVEDVPQLRYTEMVLAEAMRLYPPTWIFIRMARDPDVLPGGVAIPAGAKLFLCPYVTHRHPRYFPDPERFDPDRFNEEAKQSRPRFAYFPFGGGPRMCIAQGLAKMEGVLVLACLVRRFQLSLLPGQTIVPEPGITLSPRHGLKMRVEFAAAHRLRILD